MPPSDRPRGRRRILFIRPRLLPADEPLIDELTTKMTSALRRARVSRYWLGRRDVCMCGAVGDPTDRVLPSGAAIDPLCVDYLAYHRAEVPVVDLNAVLQLPASVETPTPAELGAPECRVRSEFNSAVAHPERRPMNLDLEKLTPRTWTRPWTSTRRTDT